VTAADLGNRAKLLLEIVKLVPGIHLREVQRRTKLGLGDTVYQLGKLESLHLIDSEKIGGYRRYYLPDVDVVERKYLSALLHPNRRLIITSLLDAKPSNPSDLASKLRIGKSTVVWHLRILESAELVSSSSNESGVVVWQLTDPARAVQMLRRLNPRALDRLSAAFLETWDLFGRN
jgi:predicted transcriptional regulator